jgi:AcrR family transcriptional regulator
MQSAVALIAEIGWGQVTTRKVAERAGVNNALIHYYFGSKEEMLRQSVMERVAEDLEAPLAALAGAGGVHEGIDAFFDAIDSSDVDNRLAMGTEALLQGLRDEVIREWAVATLDQTLAAMTALVEADQHQGKVRADLDPGGAALLMVGALDALILYRLAHSELDLSTARTAIHTMFDKENT